MRTPAVAVAVANDVAVAVVDDVAVAVRRQMRFPKLRARAPLYAICFGLFANAYAMTNPFSYVAFLVAGDTSCDGARSHE